MGTLAIIILALSAVFAVFWTFQIKKILPMVINIGMALGVAIVLIKPLDLFITGLYIYLGFVAIAFFYGLADWNRALIARLVICLMSAGIFLYWLWAINHWHGNTLLAPAFVLLMGLAGLITRAKLRNELGFLVIIAADAIAILLLESA